MTNTILAVITILITIAIISWALWFTIWYNNHDQYLKPELQSKPSTLPHVQPLLPTRHPSPPNAQPLIPDPQSLTANRQPLISNSKSKPCTEPSQNIQNPKPSRPFSFASFKSDMQTQPFTLMPDPSTLNPPNEPITKIPEQTEPLPILKS